MTADDLGVGLSREGARDAGMDATGSGRPTPTHADGDSVTRRSVFDPSFDPTVATIHRKVLERLRFQSRVGISESVLRSAVRVEDVMADALGNLTMSLNAVVLADKVADETVTVDRWVTYEAFDSWWQHTKAVHFPTLSGWLRRPPRQSEHRLHVAVTFEARRFIGYPDATLAVPDDRFGSPVIYEYVEALTDRGVVR